MIIGKRDWERIQRSNMKPGKTDRLRMNECFFLTEKEKGKREEKRETTRF